MHLSRRDLLKFSGVAAAAAAAAGCQLPPSSAVAAAGTTTRPSASTDHAGIDRRAVVRRHNPRVTQLDPFAALTVGNGEFAFTADVSGLQTVPEAYEKQFPLCTTAHWAWHTTPTPPDVRPADFRYKRFDTYGRPVPYATDRTGQEPLFEWLRQNPHRMHLGQIGFQLPSRDIVNIEQTLDLWSGLLTSRFAVVGTPVEVQTCVHPSLDLLAVRVRSPLLADRRLKLSLRFPYPSPQRAMTDWQADPARHRSEQHSSGPRGSVIRRAIDDSSYQVVLAWSEGASLAGVTPHEFILSCDRDVVELTCFFTQEEPREVAPSVSETQSDAARDWEQFWTTGGAIDLSASTHPKAHELERRIVLSQYNTALHCAGSLPSQETGLLFNSWNGKFHLEMHFWHSAHFVAWERFPLFERSLAYYQKILPQARELAAQQGYQGARWPKMVGPDGKDSPSPVGPLLIWQQPHPIYYAELCYRHYRDRATIERWRAIVEETAQFMASFAHLVDDRYVLGPPMKTVSENADTLSTLNPTFELAYWRFGLSVAQQWRERLGRPRYAAWDDLLSKLSPLPTNGASYLMQEGMTETFTKWNWEHPALLMPAAILPPAYYDREIMRNTVRKVMQTWQWDRAWGWDFGVAAAAAAAVGESELAVQALLIDSPKNRYHPNGHNYQRENLTAYLPGNGSLLLAIATMVSSNSFGGREWSAKGERLSRLASAADEK